MSGLEKIIYKILQNEHIPFVQEKQFKDLRNGLYRFDFYIPSLHILLEVQGAQHYTFNKMFYSKRSDFLKAQERDRAKISYCLAHNLKLYCLPYWEINNFTCFNDLIQLKFLATSKFHNDEAWRSQKHKD